METLVLRLALPPLTVLLAGWVQRRLGPRHSGRLVGLPLTSGPFLVVLLLSQGSAVAASAARGVLAGQLMVLVFTAGYAALGSAGHPPARLLGRVLPLVGAAAVVAHLWSWGLPWWTTGLVGPLALVALALWRPEPVVGPAGGDVAGRELAARAALTGSLVASLAALSKVVGPSVAGLLASLPLVIAVVAPATHSRDGAATARTMLRGTLAVVPGTVTFAAVVAAWLEPLGGPTAFVAGLLAMLAVNQVVDAVDSRRSAAQQGPSVASERAALP